MFCLCACPLTSEDVVTFAWSPFPRLWRGYVLLESLSFDLWGNITVVTLPSPRVVEGWGLSLSGRLVMVGGLTTAAIVMAMQWVLTPSPWGQLVRRTTCRGMQRCARLHWLSPTVVGEAMKSRLWVEHCMCPNCRLCYLYKEIDKNLLAKCKIWPGNFKNKSVDNLLNN